MKDFFGILGIIVFVLLFVKWIYRDKRDKKTQPIQTSVLEIMSGEFGIDFIFFKNVVQIISRGGTAFAFTKSDFDKFIEELKSEYEKAQ